MGPLKMTSTPPQSTISSALGALGLFGGALHNFMNQRMFTKLHFFESECKLTMFSDRGIALGKSCNIINGRGPTTGGRDGITIDRRDDPFRAGLFR